MRYLRDSISHIDCTVMTDVTGRAHRDGRQGRGLLREVVLSGKRVQEARGFARKSGRCASFRPQAGAALCVRHNFCAGGAASGIGLCAVGRDTPEKSG